MVSTKPTHTPDYTVPDYTVPDHLDSAAFMPKAVVIDPTFDWQDDSPPDTPLHRTVIYETHVRGISITHPDVPDRVTWNLLCDGLRAGA